MASTTLFTYGPSNVDTLLATTRSVLVQSKDYFNDAIFGHIPLFNILNKKLKVKKQGGASVLVPIIYGKNSTFRAYNRDDTLDTTGTEGLTMAQAKWVHYGGTITLYGDELRLNSGDGKLQDIIKAKTMQAVMSGRDALSIDLWGTSLNSKKIQPLDLLVDQTSSIQDINSTTNSWWQAQQLTSGSFAAQGEADMRNLRDTIIRQGQNNVSAPDEIITTQLISELYEQSQASGIRYGPRDQADGTFSSLKWSTANVGFDNNCISGRLYMLSSDSLQFVVHSEADWNIGEFKEPVDQDMRSAKVIFTGQLVVLNRRRNGKMVSITA